MEHAELLSLFDREQRIEIDYPDMTKESTPSLVRFLRPAPGMSFIIYSRLDEGNAEAAIDEQIERFRQHNGPFNWKLYSHDTPADLGERLRQRGFEVEEREAVMVLDLTQASPTLLSEPQADIRRITTPERLVDVVSVLEQVWERNYGWVYERMGNHLRIPGYMSIYVAYVADEPACVGWIRFDQKSSFASLWGGSTVAQYRKGGLYTAVVAKRAQEALERGYRFLTVDCSPMSQPIVARHGFKLLTYAQDHEWHPDKH